MPVSTAGGGPFSSTLAAEVLARLTRESKPDPEREALLRESPRAAAGPVRITGHRAIRRGHGRDLDFLAEFQAMSPRGHAEAYFGLMEDLQVLLGLPIRASCR